MTKSYFSGASWVRKFGYLCQILLLTKSYAYVHPFKIADVKCHTFFLIQDIYYFNYKELIKKKLITIFKTTAITDILTIIYISQL